MATNKQAFINEVEAIKGSLSKEASGYFDTVIKAKKVNKKEVEKSQIVRSAILAFLQENANKWFDRTEIGNALFDNSDIPENLLLNEKDQIAFNSITSFANQLVTDGLIKKESVKVGKSEKVKYSI
jgi:hypothetical protein